MEYMENRILLRGCLQQPPQFSHKNHDRNFFRFVIEVTRLSGVPDSLPIIAEESVLRQAVLTEGSRITVSGQIRSHNLRTDGVRHLLIFVFAEEIRCEDGEESNDVYLTGTLCREPIYRRTPLGREICDVMLAVPRGFRRADYLPCILWGRLAKEFSCCHTGDTLRINGRLQSRVYTKQTEEGAQKRTAYEISALTAELQNQI